MNKVLNGIISQWIIIVKRTTNDVPWVDGECIAHMRIPFYALVRHHHFIKFTSPGKKKMGRKKKNKAFRLPLSDQRALAGTKVGTSSFAADVSTLSTNVATLRLNTASSTRPQQQVHGLVVSAPIETPSNSHSQCVELDDDTLRKVLRYAGPLTLVAASRVSRSWRRVALEELYDTKLLHLPGALRRAGRSSIPSYDWVVRTIHTFPKLRKVSLANFPYTEYFPDIAPHVMAYLSHRTLESLDLSALTFNQNSLYTLIKSGRLPALRQLILAGCEIDGSHTSAISKALKSTQSSLDSIDLTGCGRINANELGCLLITGVIHNARVSRCENVRRISSDIPVTVKALNLHNCRNLGRFHVASGNLEELNLSQCVSLVSVHLSTATAPHKLRVLNLASCTALRDVSVGVSTQPGELEVSGFLAHMEELLLSRTRSLQAGTFSRVFELSRDICMMPKLRRLEVIGTQIQELRLQNYQELECVDASGCNFLNVVEIGECWKLAKVNLSSRNAPLARVNLHLPSKTQVLGVRKNWSCFNTESSQAISYGGV